MFQSCHNIAVLQAVGISHLTSRGHTEARVDSNLLFIWFKRI